MNTIQPHRSVPTKIIAAIVIALAFSGAIHAEDKNKKGSTPPAQKPAPKASTPSSSPKPQRPATNNGGGAGTGSTRGSGTQNGSSGGTGNSVRPDSRVTGGYKPGATGTGSVNTRVGLTKGPNGKPEVYKSSSGSEARLGRDGKVREIHSRGITVVHGPANTRRIVVERPDRSRFVVYGGGRGYVQRPFLYHGHEFAGRTYYYFGRPYSLYYRRYPYRGLYLAGYAPYRYYRPGFYGWVYNPWLSPVAYGWGWVGSPWYRYYGYYFSPYSVYPSASFWLTDYLIAASLQEAYQPQQEGADSFVASTDGQTVLTPDIKQAIASEVQSQIALENAESQTATQGGDLDMNSSGLPRMLSEASPSHPRIFVLATPIGVTGADGQECALSEGDVLRLSTPPPPGSTTAYLQVFASKNGDCVRGNTVSVGLEDLQEMQNHMRASIDRGLEELQAHKGGLPMPPQSAAAPPIEASFAPIAPPADPNVSRELQEQENQADTAEQEVLNEVKQADAGGNGSSNSTGAGASVGTPSPAAEPSKPPLEIALGQTIDQVVSTLGSPKQIVKLGPKQIYVYSDIKITFVDGKVSNVE